MSYHSLGITYDGNLEYLTAAYYYELSVSEERTANAFIDLSVLYFQFTDLGLNSASGLPVDFVQTAFARYDLIIERGIDAFPFNMEMRFWKRYFSSRTIYDELSEQDVIEIMKDGEFSNIPYFYLYLTNPGRYEEKRLELLASCGSIPSSKNRWIISLLADPALT